ncbi:6291_t:CDS:2 [Entrophospora sp. SA101]|nr:6291_t:CDS:2 [Entrophospora sp. SA101]CAJ0830026.1 6300_t:CDS:2 [Entrophospora sp. SA101]CAJ0908116.1 19509_t:CDS:2 [Entrophospora sp. SA101]
MPQDEKNSHGHLDRKTSGSSNTRKITRFLGITDNSIDEANMLDKSSKAIKILGLNDSELNKKSISLDKVVSEFRGNSRSNSLNSVSNGVGGSVIVASIRKHVVHKGYLSKHTNTNFVLSKSWKKRYFVLAKSILYCFKSNDATSNLIDSFELTCDTVVCVSDVFSGKAWILEVSKPNIKAWYLQADNVKALKSWLTELKSIVVKLKYNDTELPSNINSATSINLIKINSNDSHGYKNNSDTNKSKNHINIINNISNGSNTGINKINNSSNTTSVVNSPINESYNEELFFTPKTSISNTSFVQIEKGDDSDKVIPTTPLPPPPRHGMIITPLSPAPRPRSQSSSSSSPTTDLSRRRRSNSAESLEINILPSRKYNNYYNNDHNNQSIPSPKGSIGSHHSDSDKRNSTRQSNPIVMPSPTLSERSISQDDKSSNTQIDNKTSRRLLRLSSLPNSYETTTIHDEIVSLLSTSASTSSLNSLKRISITEEDPSLTPSTPLTPSTSYSNSTSLPHRLHYNHRSSFVDFPNKPIPQLLPARSKSQPHYTISKKFLRRHFSLTTVDIKSLPPPTRPPNNESIAEIQSQPPPSSISKSTPKETNNDSLIDSKEKFATNYTDEDNIDPYYAKELSASLNNNKIEKIVENEENEVEKVSSSETPYDDNQKDDIIEEDITKLPASELTFVVVEETNGDGEIILNLQDVNEINSNNNDDNEDSSGSVKRVIKDDFDVISGKANHNNNLLVT